MDKIGKDFKNGNEMSYLKKRLIYMYNLYVFMCKIILYRHLIINYCLNYLVNYFKSQEIYHTC